MGACKKSTFPTLPNMIAHGNFVFPLRITVAFVRPHNGGFLAGWFWFATQSSDFGTFTALGPFEASRWQTPQAQDEASSLI